ncbi:hypothetical protein SLEP1_g56990 [Rubroshorea leprosula]|uniref:Uncharacterized protein n=2 Tax=Rubroshorea leprosula TaxID=152421 RepID=A0AAV5MPD0_9ROSI|nr:hypothetical protein SLEP1_g56990 [Rubroshorea leprosula]
MDVGRMFDGCATGDFVSFELYAGFQEDKEVTRVTLKIALRINRVDLRGMNVEGSIEKVRADLKEIDFERPIEMLKDEMSTELVQDESNG